MLIRWFLVYVQKRQERDRRRQAKAMKEKEAEKQKLLDAIQVSLTYEGSRTTIEFINYNLDMNSKLL